MQHLLFYIECFSFYNDGEITENSILIQAPNKPSNCILATFRHLQTFSNDYSGTILTADECKEFLTLAMEEITKKYLFS
jgi:hypothetical protein